MAKAADPAEFKSGDLVRIRYRDEMPLFSKYTFVSEMEKWSGREFVVHAVLDGRVMFDGMSPQMMQWLWCTEMIELVEPRMNASIDEREIFDLLDM